jgi:hypothetical protein
VAAKIEKDENQNIPTSNLVQQLKNNPCYN